MQLVIAPNITYVDYNRHVSFSTPSSDNISNFSFSFSHDHSPSYIPPLKLVLLSQSPPHSYTHQMVTLSQNNIFKPKQIKLTTKHSLLPTNEPSCISQALSNPLCQKTIFNEFTTLIRNETW